MATILNSGGGTIQTENRRWGNAVPPRSPLLWPLHAVVISALFFGFYWLPAEPRGWRSRNL